MQELGYGVHYGQYKADHPCTKGPETPPDTGSARICPQCGDRFFLTRFNQKYCSTRCQNLAGMRRYNQRKKEAEKDAQTLGE